MGSSQELLNYFLDDFCIIDQAEVDGTEQIDKADDQTTSLPTQEKAPVETGLEETAQDSSEPSKQWRDWLQKQFLNKNLL